jgi:hypothetical protein
VEGFSKDQSCLSNRSVLMGGYNGGLGGDE